MFKYPITHLNMLLVKYECQKTGGNRKYVLQLMVNYNVV